MTIYINDEPVEIFSGATVADALRKAEGDLLTDIEAGNKIVTDRYDNERDLDGELSDGEKLFVR